MAFTKNVYAVTLDLKQTSQAKLLAVEGDTANRIEATITNNGAAVNLTNRYVRAVFKRSDGKVVTMAENDTYRPLVVDKARGKVTIDVKNGCFRDGDNYMELQILYSSTNDPDTATVLSTTSQLLIRARNCLMTEDAVRASAEITALVAYLRALNDMDVTVTTLSAGSSVTASLSYSDGAYHLALGIPRGADGSNGIDGQDGRDGQDGQDGADAPTITGITLSGTNLVFAFSNSTSISVSVASLMPTVDSALSSSSENPVQNKVLYGIFTDASSTFALHADAIDALEDDVDALEAAMPTKVSDLTNDSGFITSSDLPTDLGDLSNDAGYLTNADLPTKISDLTDDSGHYTLPSGGIPTADIADGAITTAKITGGAVTNAKLATMDSLTLKGNKTNAKAYPTDISVADVKTMLAMTGAGSSAAGAAGVVPAPAAGDNTKFLRGDGTWQTVSGGGGSAPSASTSTPLEDGTASAGSSDAYARGDHRHPHDGTKQDVWMYSSVTIAVADWEASGNAYAAVKTVTGITTGSLVFVKYSDTETAFTEDVTDDDEMTFGVAALPSAAVTVDVSWFTESTR